MLCNAGRKYKGKIAEEKEGKNMGGSGKNCKKMFCKMRWHCRAAHLNEKLTASLQNLQNEICSKNNQSDVSMILTRNVHYCGRRFAEITLF